MRLRQILAVAPLLLILAATGCKSSTSSGRYAAPPTMQLDPAKTYAATLVTAKGTIELSLDAKAAPNTVNNFVFLAKHKFYDGLVFHRVEPGFVIQGGDPDGNGGGGPGYSIPDEKSGLKHIDGALAMAKTSEPKQRRQPVLHHARRAAVARCKLHGLRPGHVRQGSGRQDRSGRQDSVADDHREVTHGWAFDA